MNRSCRRRKGSHSRASWILAVLLSVPCLPWTPTQPTQALAADEGEDTHLELFARLADTYLGRTHYRDQGTIHMRTFEEGVERAYRLRFATRVSPAGFELRLAPEDRLADDHGATVIWTEGRGGELLRYDENERIYAPVASFSAAVPAAFGEAVAEALLVPQLLLGMVDPRPFVAQVDAAVGQPCLDSAGGRSTGQVGAGAWPEDALCRVLTWSQPTAAGSPRRLRLWVTEADDLVRRVEAERPPEDVSEAGPTIRFAPSAAWVWVTVIHDPVPTSAGDSPVIFQPPREARRVNRLEDAGPEPKTILFAEEIRVVEYQLTARVIGRDGEPVNDLTADDFRLTVRGQEVPLRAAAWVDSRDPWLEEVAAMPLAQRRQLGLEEVVPGRLVVVFFQADMHPVRLKGHLAFRPHLMKIMRSLQPTDRVAVVTFDSHLKVWQDFTTERDPLKEIFKVAFRFGARKVEARPGDVTESLVEHLDPQAARKVARVEEAVALVARTLEPIVAEKVVLFVGWGMGHNGIRAYRESLRTLRDTDTVLHAVDVTFAEGHTLGPPLASVAQASGGVYASIYNFPNYATRLVTIALSGYYRLSINEEDLPQEGGRARLELRDRHRGRLYDEAGILWFPDRRSGD